MITTEFDFMDPRVKTLSLLFLSTAALLLVGCGGADDADIDKPKLADVESPETDESSATSPQEQTSNGSNTKPLGQPTTFRSPSAGVTFRVPAGWVKQELSGTLATVHEAKFTRVASGESAELTFSVAGGGVEFNLDRWRGQVQSGPGDQRKEEAITLAGREGTLVDLQGTYSSVSSGSQSGYRVIGAAVPMAQQGYYVKLIGPAAEVSMFADDFREMLESAAPPPRR